ncbi:MAG: molybdopterin-dependent oxidoreductase [Candidatus Poribacteria bacterium]|nr:molybdopterin-dependent oxidoreductase [Candidatus Poribacteria bacterium]
MKRRRFIKLSAISAAGMVLPLRLEGETAAMPSLKPSTLITPNADFYILQIGDPAVLDAASWRMVITGLIEKPMPPLRLEDITAMEAVTAMRTLKCIGDPIGTEQMSNANWKGIRLRNLLEKVGPKPEAKVVVFRCADGYHTAIPLEEAMETETLLAYEMNDVPLPTEHGFPIRLLNPGNYGTKNPKWIVNIQLAAEHESYWEKRGWDPIARVKLATMIGTPSEGEEITGGKVYTVSGAAFDAGNHGGIKKVEVSIDYGQTWEEAEIWAKDSPLAWVLWKWDWQVPEKSEPVEIYARATAHSGVTQDEIGIEVEPVGATGYHMIDAAIVTP